MSRKHGRRKPMAEINVVPYIDVTLVLLIIFMITTPMLQTGVEVDLPQAESKTVESEGEGNNPPIVISIKEQGQFYIKSDSQDDEPVLPEEINSRVAAILINKPKTQVLINADKGVSYGTVVTVMAALKNAGVPTVGLMTKPEEK
ncbi:protein TolR [Methylobacter sp. S3L5C]|jgi:biopolymer transport protein TolR|uniref:protein TolR n=1 Tax=Methylobacter sp. S3L5C TaxID=2839024 RepID=UPI001FAD7E02|nr:protein TolR [Methylobacter sp. S3L5C]UOA10299.1 protein TolR [Methylobacter sp. S3L5C]